jgi:hypothetical protein
VLSVAAWVGIGCLITRSGCCGVGGIVPTGERPWFGGSPWSWCLSHRSGNLRRAADTRLDHLDHRPPGLPTHQMASSGLVLGTVVSVAVSVTTFAWAPGVAAKIAAGAPSDCTATSPIQSMVSSPQPCFMPRPLRPKSPSRVRRPQLPFTMLVLRSPHRLRR